ncbi:MAG: 4Fe-4S binding protein [Deltaproteobacteria bacterium]|jgi:polyferredoxin|nr:4Fe-4S binding protein [Deltaproteobacteria bacterium]
MRLTDLRLISRHVSFVTLMYGGRFGLQLGPALPCFSCPYVGGCAGNCYLMGLQGYIGLGAKFAGLWSPEALRAAGWLAVFLALCLTLGKAWCGWVCPFGLLSDWLTFLRRKLGLRALQLSPRTLRGLGSVKYLLLAWLLIGPVLIRLGLLHPDFYLPFCQICPGKSLLPLFAGETRYLALDLTNPVTAGLSGALIVISAFMVAGMFWRERFFCLFCPMLAILHLLKPFYALKLLKNPSVCRGCAACRRVCPMEIEAVFLEKSPRRVQVQPAECLGCGDCLAHCASGGGLEFRFLGRRLIASSGRQARGEGLIP